MARNWTLVRQEAEALVELLESNEDFQIHDGSALEKAAELRGLFGMATREEEVAARPLLFPPNHFAPKIELPAVLYQGNFSDAMKVVSGVELFS